MKRRRTDSKRKEAGEAGVSVNLRHGATEPPLKYKACY